jgi:acyl-coenzyme A synthetase/AMP-(fatty) acid ligase
LFLFPQKRIIFAGDIGYNDSNGWTYVVDRKKELIKVKGLQVIFFSFLQLLNPYFQVAPAELEDLLLSNPKIQDCAVIGVNDLSAGEVPKAFVVKGDQSLSEEEVQKYVAGKQHRTST